ncbi:MAG: transposase [Candidatus Brocadiales bacterium]|nr:transposase [Candidatus Brocadiales bacterium]
MFTEYSPEFKESMLQKIFFNPDRSVVSFAREASIPGSTVATWVRNHKKKNGKIMGQRKQVKLWSAEKKFETVLLTASMSEAEKSEYCRKHGIYPAQLKEWKEDCIAGCRNAPDKKYIKEAKEKEQQYKKKTRSLEKDLRRKEKALAETAALLVLKKKVQEIWGEPEDE